MGMEIIIDSLEDMCMLMCDNIIPSHKSDEHIYTRCLRCGRKLKTEESKIRGYGKTCEQKMRTEIDFPLF